MLVDLQNKTMVFDQLMNILHRYHLHNNQTFSIIAKNFVVLHLHHIAETILSEDLHLENTSIDDF